MRVRTPACLLLLALVGVLLGGLPADVRGQVHEVPEPYSTIAAALEAAAEGDTILVAPGTHVGSFDLTGREVVVGSRFLTTGNTSYVRRTVVDGNGGQRAVWVDSSQTVETALVGLTIRNADDCIYANGRFRLLNVYITGCTDGVDYETRSGGLIRHSTFAENSDDGIDLDQDVDILIEHNRVTRNENDGIEIRLHPYTGPTLDYVIRENTISRNVSDGIQLIGYPGVSDRRFRIERNRIRHNGKAGIGCMSDGQTDETYEAATLPEPIELVENVFEGNDRDVTCGGV